MNRRRVWNVAIAVSFMCTVCAAKPPANVKLVPVSPEALAQRREALARSAPDAWKLLAYLDCGSQLTSTDPGTVKIAWKPGEVYLFPSEAKDVPVTQASVAFHSRQVVFEVSGLDRAKKYEASVTWWDYDDGGRTQMITTQSPNGHQVQMAVPAIRLPNYTSDHQPPVTKRFRLPVSLAVDDKLRIVVDQVTGVNVVVSEVCVWQVNSSP